MNVKRAKIEARTHEVAVVAIENLTGPASNEVNNQEQDSQQTVQSASNVVEDNETVQQDNDPLAEENNSKVPAFEDLIILPKVYYNDTTAWVVINEIDQLTIHVASVEEAVALGLAVYYIKDLSYPSSFSQLLGLIESLCLGNMFFSISGKESKRTPHKTTGKGLSVKLSQTPKQKRA